jgi:hypothetical protein
MSGRTASGTRRTRIALLALVCSALSAAAGAQVTQVIDSTGDGAGIELSAPSALVVDPAGNVFVGDGINPLASLSVLTGTPSPGETLVLGIDNPLGTHAAGSWPLLAIAALPDLRFPCGTRMAEHGMIPPHASELLLGAPPLLYLAGLPW